MLSRLLFLDVAGVMLFVILGRTSHSETNQWAEVVVTATPFLMAAVVGWMATRAWRTPLNLRTGIGVLLSTVVIGMAIRSFVFGEGIAPLFVAVATGFLALFLLGWRLIATWTIGRRSARIASQ